LVSCDFLQKIIEKAVPENTPGGKCPWPIAFPGPKIVLTKLLLLFEQLVDCCFHIIVVLEVFDTKMMFLGIKEI
jgi:hypothetical protein